MSDFFDSKLFGEADRQVSFDASTLAENDREKDILQRLIKIEAATEEKHKRVSSNWDRFEQMIYGNQWATEIRGSTEYNAEGLPVYTININNENTRDDMPKRTRNYIFPLIESELALFNSLAPIPRCTTFNFDNKDLMYKRNLYLNSVFGNKTPKEYLKAAKDAAVYGEGFLKLRIDGTVDVENGEIPFSVISERTRDIKADPLADNWEDVRWVIFEVNRYNYEVKAKYKKYKSNADDYEVVKLKEFWVRDGNRWNQYILCGGRLLKIAEGKQSYPVNPFNVFRYYLRDKGWHGISEVALLMEEQVIINKRTSQMDWYVSMLTDTPTEVAVSNLAEGESRKLPLRPGQHFTVRSAIHPTFRPVQQAVVNPSLFIATTDEAKAQMETSIGVQKTAMGENAQGVYTGAHYQRIQDSVYARIKLKEFWIKEALKGLAIKSLILAKEWTKEGRFFRVYDDSTSQFIELDHSVFADVGERDVIVETADAAVMDPGERIEKLIEMKQYVPNMDDRFFMRSIECVRPKFFDPRQMDQINQSLMFEEKAKGLQMEAQLKQLILTNTQLDLQLKQLQAQEQQMQMGQQTAMAGQPQETQPESAGAPAVPEQAGTPPASIPSPEAGETQPPVSEEAPPPEFDMGGDGTIDWQEVIQSAATTLSQMTGMPVEDAVQMVQQILMQIKQDMPGSPDTAIAAEFVKRLQQNVR
jgi:hypothetical protein